MSGALHYSTWWLEGRRLQIGGSFGHVGFVPLGVDAAVDRLRTRDHVLAHHAERVLYGGDGDGNDLRYLVLAQPRRVEATAEDGKVHLRFELRASQTLKRALAQHVDLGERHVCLQTNQLFQRYFELETEPLDESCGEAVQGQSGIVLVHGIISFRDRLKLRARRAYTNSLVDDLLAVRGERAPKLAVAS